VRDLSLHPHINSLTGWNSLLGNSWFHHDNHCGNRQEIKTLTPANGDLDEQVPTVHTGHFKEVILLFIFL